MSLSRLQHFLQVLLQKIKQPLFQARGRRVLVEILIVQLLVTLVAPFCIFALTQSLFLSSMSYEPSSEISQELTREMLDRQADVSAMNYVMFIVMFNGLSVLWGVLRWRRRPAHRSRRKQIVLEWAMVCAFLCTLIIGLSLSYWILGNLSAYSFLRPVLNSQEYSFASEISFSLEGFYIGVLYASVFVAACAFLTLRTVVYVLLFWNRLRKRHLQWALTHAHLMILVWLSSLTYLVVILAYLGDTLTSTDSFIEGFLSFLLGLGGVLFMVTIIDVFFILPPSAIFSFLFTRRIVSRIKDLTVTAGALRGGDYSARVTVRGEDELARLQSDFNVMAENLERTLYELQEERDNVATLLQSRRELIASVSHELRTPVATVRSYLESTLSTWKDAPPPGLRQDLQVMEQQVMRLQALINDLFTLARAEVGRLEMRNIPVNVELLVQRVVDTMAPVVWRGSRVEVLADIATVTPHFPRVLADENRLEQILQNLLHNAVRHTPPGGIIVVGASVDEQAVVLQVKDTGEGIATEELQQIWERFYRAKNTSDKSASGGAGLGLAIVKDLSEAMGGVVTVHSEPGQGTVFTIRLPKIQTTNLANDVPGSSAITSPLSLTAPKIAAE